MIDRSTADSLLSASGYKDFRDYFSRATYNGAHPAPDTFASYPVDEMAEAFGFVLSADRRKFTEKGKTSTSTSGEAPKKVRLTWEALLCELGKRGWWVRFNEILQVIEVSGAFTLTSKRMMEMDDIITVLHSDLATDFTDCSMDTICNYLTYIANEHAYNPVLELLSETKWDGKDRLPELFALMHIENDSLSKVLVSKWLLQTVALLFNNKVEPFGAEGVLVLNGSQGLCKTTLLGRLALRPQWFGKGLGIRDNDKDTSRRCITRWITELGEVESTLKSDISALKAFVTNDIDSYRLPYGRSDRTVARHTSLCATCNSDRYLIDPTGNRRWWSVPITQSLDYDAIQAFDALQLWAQMYPLVAPLTQEERGACFRLTADEQRQLADRNGDFEKPIKAELECRDIIEKAKNQGYAWKQMTVTEWKDENVNALRGYSVQQIGEALTKIGIMPGRTTGGKRTRLLPSTYCRPGEAYTVVQQSALN